MAVNWYWAHKLGVMTYKQENGTFKINVYRGNCLGVLIYEYKDENKKNKYTFQGFWNDERHLKNCLGLSKDYKANLHKDNGCVSIKLNTYYKDSLLIGSLFAKSGLDVSYYRKEPKK